MQQISHLLLRLIAFLILEPRLRRGSIAPSAVERLKPVCCELMAVYQEAGRFFASIDMCRNCNAGCCGGAFNRFTIYDHVSHLVSEVEDPPEWGYRLYPLASASRNRVDEGWCQHYIGGRGCRLENSQRPAMCIWWLCGRMEASFTDEQKARVRQFRKAIDRVFWVYARVLVFGGIRRTAGEGYLELAGHVIADTVSLTRSRGWRQGLAFVQSRVWSTSENVLFERVADPAQPPCDVPGLEIVKVNEENRTVHEANAHRIGLGSNRRNFKKGATCYMAYLGGDPVGIGWRFDGSRLLRRMRYPETAVYLAGFRVVEHARGRGIYPAMLGFICRDVGATNVAVLAETAPGNVASQRGLAKAGFGAIGRLRTWVMGGLILRWRLEKLPRIA